MIDIDLSKNFKYENCELFKDVIYVVKSEMNARK